MLYLPQPKKRHILGGSGGSHAALSTAGALIPISQVLSPDECETMGAVSGAVGNMMMFAAGIPVSHIVQYNLEHNYSDLLPKHRLFKTVLKSLFVSEWKHEETVQQGLLSSYLLGEAIAKHVKRWPRGFWTAAVSGEKLYIFTDKCVFECAPGQHRHIIHAGPAPVVVGVRATVTIPLLIDPIRFKDRVMQDGALSEYGTNPVGLMQDHFGAREQDIYAIVPDGQHTLRKRMLFRFGKHLAGNHQPVHPQHAIPGLIQPSIEGFRSLEFDIELEDKQEAILAGHRAATKVLRDLGDISDSKFRMLNEAGENFATLADFLHLENEPAAELRTAC